MAVATITAMDDSDARDDGGSRTASRADDRTPPHYLTLPNAFTLLRLCCIPVFVWLLFGRDSRLAAGLLLGALGATDWVDGWLARRFNQVSEFGAMFDPTADRLLFVVAITSIIIDGSAPLWFCVAVMTREVLVGGTVAVATLFLRMARFDVTWWGKTATFLLMFAFPGFLLGESGIAVDWFFEAGAWILGLPGLVLSVWTGIGYAPLIRDGIRRGRGAADT